MKLNCLLTAAIPVSVETAASPEGQDGLRLLAELPLHVEGVVPARPGAPVLPLLLLLLLCVEGDVSPDGGILNFYIDTVMDK